MYQTIEQFIQEWELESQGTFRLFQALTDESLQQEVLPGYRTAGRLAWHIVTTIPEMMSRTGLELHISHEEETVPASAAKIAEAYKEAAAALIEAIRRQWTDSKLTDLHNLYGDEWPNALTLNILIKHEIHHRGQLTILMRQAGLQIHGLYGPAKQEWGMMGAPEPVV